MLNFKDDIRISRPYSQKNSAKNSIVPYQSLSVKPSKFKADVGSKNNVKIMLDKLEEEERKS